VRHIEKVLVGLRDNFGEELCLAVEGAQSAEQTLEWVGGQ